MFRLFEVVADVPAEIWIEAWVVISFIALMVVQIFDIGQCVSALKEKPLFEEFSVPKAHARLLLVRKQQARDRRLFIFAMKNGLLTELYERKQCGKNCSNRVEKLRAAAREAFGEDC